MSRYQRALLGLLAASALSVPAFSVAVAAPPKKAPAKGGKKPAKPGPKAEPKPDAKAGKELFKSEGCTGCHKTADFKDGGTTGPDLSKIGTEQKESVIADVILHPKSGSIMPATKDKKKALDMTAYLMTQK